MKTLAERLSWAITHAGIKKIDLAKACGISRGAVSQWFNGTTKSLEGSNLTNAAKATGVNPHWLATGNGARVPMTREQIIESLRPGLERNDGSEAIQFDANVEPAPGIKEHQIPLISWVQAGLFCTAPDLFQPGDAEKWLPSHKTHGPHTFALRVKGDSMVSPYPGQRSYPDGTIIYVDPDKPLTNKCRVVARIHDAEEATFKEYVEDAGVRYLKPINPQYPIIKLDESMHICGVVVLATMEE